jgi:hypothetical protein
MEQSTGIATPAQAETRGYETAVNLLHERVREQLGRVMRSKAFERAHRMRSLLEYVVEGAIHGRSATQSMAARELFGKSDDFDPSLDPVIRVQFGRLRKALANYYDGEGKGDSVVIEIPNRRYTAVFHD